MSDVTLRYTGSDILELSDSGSATLKTGGKYCEDDVTVEYVKPSGGGDPYEKLVAVNNNTATSISNSDIATVRDYMFYGNSNLVSVSLPNATEINGGAFYNCTRLSDVSFPNCISAKDNAFFGCKALKKISDENFPKFTDIGKRTFRNTGIEYVVKPKSIMGFGGVCFESCASLKAVDVLSWFYQYGNQNLLFQYCSSFDTFIIRGTTVNALGNVSYINRGTPFADGGTGGTLYVPQALISDYQNATNWSTILGYSNNQILPIEGSYYETHYADGTVIS